MNGLKVSARVGAAAALLLVTTACSGTGGLGGVLGDVLGGGGGGNQVAGTIQGVNTRTQQLGITQSNGQTLTLSYDNNTQVIYQNQNYPVTSLEWGDEVTARISNSNNNNNSNYTDRITVTRSVGGDGGTSGNLQTFEGTVRSIDRSNGLFTISSGNQGVMTVAMPYNARQNDITRFNNLRNGDFVRVGGVLVSNARIDLRQFY